MTAFIFLLLRLPKQTIVTKGSLSDIVVVKYSCRCANNLYPLDKAQFLTGYSSVSQL